MSLPMLFLAADVMWPVPLILLAISLLLHVGPSFSCTTSVSVQDLGCRLHWSCSDVGTAATNFTVQAKIQGEVWRNVPHCVQISHDSCDLSQVFKDLVLYKFVKMGLNQGHGRINWTSQEICDPIKNPNATFSPPSLSISLKEQQLWVEVIFPCAPYALCLDEDEDEDEEGGEEDTVPSPCCPLTDFMILNTTVTLYNKHDMDLTQTRSEPVQITPWNLQFAGLAPGQEYCAVAHFASSPLSVPKCIHVPLLENPNLFVMALCGVFLAFLLIMGFVLRKWWGWCASTDLQLPKSLMALVQSQDQEGSVVDEPRQAAFEEEESIVHISIVSLNEMLPSDRQVVYPHLQSLGDRYYTTTLLHERFCDVNEDTDYLSGDIVTDGVERCASPAYYQWPRWSSLPALRTGVVCLLGNVLPSEGSGIPLSSVRVAGAQLAKMESDHSFKVFPTLYSDGD